jgi:hypothetical protein
MMVAGPALGPRVTFSSNFLMPFGPSVGVTTLQLNSIGSPGPHCVGLRIPSRSLALYQAPTMSQAPCRLLGTRPWARASQPASAGSQTFPESRGREIAAVAWAGEKRGRGQSCERWPGENFPGKGPWS